MSSNLEDRLQPSLLDRLTDDDPSNPREPSEKRSLSASQLRAAVTRDLTWLLSTGDLEQLEDLTDYPEVRTSTLNYGMAVMTGRIVAGLSPTEIERRLRQRIIEFEPRLLPESLQVRVKIDPERMSRNALYFDIEAELWSLPMPQRLLLKSEKDLETGQVLMADAASTGAH